jgi:streptogramin lyase
MTSYAHGKGTGAFIGGVFDGQSIWLVPYYSTDLVKVNPADGTMTSYAHGKGTGAFTGGVFDGQSIWLVPFVSADLVKVNPADGTMTSYAHGKGATAFIEGVFDGQSIWLVPYNSTDLVSFSPLGFGIKATPMAGGKTSVLTLDDGANWRITMSFVKGILVAGTTAASSGQCATWS